MAFQNANYSNNNDVYTPVTRCGFKFYNPNSKIDPSTMSFSYWNGLLKITINPIIVKEGSANKVNMDNHIDIYLSPMRATLLLHFVEDYVKNPDEYGNNVGVTTNKGIIYITNGKQFGEGIGTALIINLIGQNGEKEGEAAYEFNTQDTFAVSNYNGGSDYKKRYEYSDIIEIDMFMMILRTFIEASTSAMAASYIENMKYTTDREYNFIKDVRQHLGISNDSNKSNNSYNRSNFFNNNPGSQPASYSNSAHKANTASYEEVMNDISSMMD